MTVYALAQLKIHDRERYGRYMSRFMPVLEKYNGRLLAADEGPRVLEGQWWDRNKVVLMALWAGTPLLVWSVPGVFGLFEPHTDGMGFIRQVGALWLALGVGGLLFRTVHLFFIADVKTVLVWMTKILTDPFHDIKLYHKAPLFLLRGQLIDPGVAVK